MTVEVKLAKGGQRDKRGEIREANEHFLQTPMAGRSTKAPMASHKDGYSQMAGAFSLSSKCACFLF